MKKFVLFLAFVLIVPSFQVFAQVTPSITGITQTELIAGESELVISGVGFFEPFNSLENQICFGELCYDADGLNDYLTQWNDTEIRLIVPPDVPAGSGNIKLRVYFETTQTFDFIESAVPYTVSLPPEEIDDVDDVEGDDTVDDVEGDDTVEPEPDAEPELLLPSITSFSPPEVVPGETVISISGEYFGSGYVYGLNQICFENTGCILDSDISTYLKGWSDTLIQVLVPPYVLTGGKVALVLNIPTTEEYGLAYSENSFSVKVADDPKITSISPTTVVPGVSSLTISGTGFGDTFNASNNQICFGENCISAEYISSYLQVWNDTEIVVKVPSFVTETSGTVFLRLYKPSIGNYDYFESPAYTVSLRPIIEWFYAQMDQGGIYTFSGTNFGADEGGVYISGVKCENLSWSDTSVTFAVPLDAASGPVYLENANGIKSQELPVTIVPVTVYSDDEYSRYQWYLETLNVEKAWDITTGSNDVIVAVIDSGVDISHEDLKHAIWKNSDEVAGNNKDDDGNGYVDDVYGWDFVLGTNSTAVKSGHGTMVASLIAAKKDNNVGIAGVAPGVKIMSLNVANSDGLTISIDAALNAVKYAVDNGADIINMSFGGYYSGLYDEVIQYAYDNNVLIVVSAGNEGVDMDSENAYPVCTDLDVNAVLGIAATSEDNRIAYFSNYGEQCTDFSAPGENIALAMPTSLGGYGMGNGTSFSAPLVAGLAALIKSEHKDWNVEEIKKVLISTAVNIDGYNPLIFGKTGYGIPDAYEALLLGKPSVSYDYKPTTDVVIEETGAEVEIELPEVEPITEPEPVKNDEGMKNDESIDTMISSDSSFFDVFGTEFASAIGTLENKGIVSGYPDGTFKPDFEINRAEFTKIVVNAFGITPSGMYCFLDVKDEWFAPYVCAARSMGIINGYPDGTFGPEKNINMVEALKIIMETAWGVKFQADPGQDWYYPYVMYAVKTPLDFILYRNDYGDNVTRGEMAEMIFRLL